MNESAVVELIRQFIAEKLNVSAEKVDPRERFRRLGVDSLTATSMLVFLGTRLERSLSPTLAWQFPTPMELARYLAGQAGAAAAPAGRQRHADDEPIAIVGVSCRFPGAPDPGAFWRLLHDGVDAVREVPRDRWDMDALYDADGSAPGKMSTRFGGFLDDVASFDASFFGISPREAAEMDPQQRLMLELSWEALEDAGLQPPRLKDTRTGVFFGAMWMDYTHAPEATQDRIGQHTATGQDLSIIPARVSYTLGLLGPSVQVNTACSSSLVAVHVARQSLLRGESNLALAGAVNLILSPDSMITMSKFGAAAPDGRCKAFDAAANGYVRSEGAGVVVLKRLSDAIADGDHVYCVIRGSAINNDGFSNGLTAPSPKAQEGVLRDAYSDAGVAPADVQYVEAHGTGTMLGDPIEAGALGAVLGRAHPPDRPLRIGSVKTNIGHLEPAAGMAGLIKVALSMSHRELPASLHFKKPNPHIPFDDLRLRVQAKRETWETDDGRRIAGVSSFGFGGTNAHVVLESTDSPRSVRLAAASAAALQERARSLIGALRAAPSVLYTLPENPADAAVAPHRLTVTASSARELIEHLEAFLKGAPGPGLLVGTAPSSPPKVVLVFGGQGSQWLGMGRALLRDEPVARAVLQQCDHAIRRFAGWSLIERLQSDDPTALERTDFVQLALFSMQVALAQAMRARGLKVDAVVGQSMGEVAAAHVAGALSLTDAVRVMCVRTQLLVEKGERGRMLVTGLSADAAKAAIAPFGGRLSVVVEAGPESTVVGGPEDDVLALRADLEKRDVPARVVRADYASHSPYMDPLLPELAERLAGLRPKDGDVAFWSTVSAGPVDGSTLDATYWTRNLRQPVLFAPTVQRLAVRGPTVFVEVDPHPVLALFVEQCIAHARAQGTVIGCAARDEPEPLTLREAAGRLYVAGRAVAAEGAPDAADHSAQLVVLSARTPEAVRAAAGRLRDHVTSHPAATVADVAYSLVTTRSHMECRLAMAVSTREELNEALEDALTCTPDPSDGEPPKVVFVFPGQGSQWLGMGCQLLDEEPAFADAIRACDRAIAAEAGWSVLDELRASPERSRLDRIDVVQPLLFAMEVALAALWRSWGIEPHAVVGHSMGEIAAACVSGALSLEDAAAVICRRSALLKRVSGKGEMALVELSVDEAAAAIRGAEDRVGIAVSNGTRSTVLSGDPAALAKVLAALEGRGVFCRRIKVDFASHSPQVDPLLEELVSQVASVAPRAATLPMRSTVTGKTIAGPELTARYWGDNLRQPVCFADAVKALIAEGFTQFIEISPHPVLVSAVDELRKELGSSAFAVGSTRREQPERRTLLESLGALFVHGHPLDAGRLFPSGGRLIPLPTYPWQRQRHWLAPATKKHASGEAAAHPLLGVRIPVARADALYESTLTPAEPAFVADHRVGGHAMVPGAALAEMMRAAAEDHAGGQPAQAQSVVMQVPLVLPQRGARSVQVVLTNRGQASIYSRASDAPPGVGWTLHATAEVSTVPVAPPAAVDLAAIRRRCPEAVDVGAAYAKFAALGLEYGPALQGLQRLSLGPAEALAEVALPHGLQPDGYGVHPALLDAALQAVIAAAGVERQGIVLPFDIGRLVVHRQGASSALVHVRLDLHAADGIAADVTLVDPAGAVVAELMRLRLRRADLALIRRSGDASPLDAFYRLDWVPADAPAPSNGAAGRWAVVSIGESGASSRLARALRAKGARAELVAMADLKGTAAENIVCVWEPGGDPEAGIRMATEGLSIVKALAGRAQATRLWWVTRGAMAVAPGEGVDPASAAVWGLGRTVVLEQPELRGTLVDLARADDVADVLAREVAAGDDETQIAWRAATRHVARLVRAPAPTTVPGAPNYRLEAKQKGTLDALRLVAASRSEPGPGEVEIEVAATGLNFRDVLGALGMIPETGALGTECAGVITRVGPGVSQFATGDRVMALAKGALGRFVSIDARWVARVPAGLSLEQAATVPAVFLTAWHALYDLAQLKRGERIVIHAAAGGVGMAAIQIAQWIGAEILATASPLKWDVVRSLGVKRVASSRDTSFADAFRSAAGGADVILNSLAGEFVDAGLSLLSAGGRFIEMGKIDIREAAAVAAANPGITYRAFDLFALDPDKIASLFQAVREGFASGHLKPLPLKTFPLSEAPEAFRFMAQARQVGKVALVAQRASLRVDGSAVIVGGLGGLGLEVARDLAARGMKHLVLTGRRGLTTPGAASAVAELEGAGARVTVAAVDVADRAALAKVLGSIPAELPLRAVIHSAVVLDDGMLAEQTPDRFRRVMAPKVLGAWNLHELTAGADLDAFVLFSSMVGTLGNASQGAYAAANAYLDALAVHRGEHGQPATSLAWGPWAELGLAAGLKAQLQARWTSRGFAMISPAQGMALFDKALTRRQPHLVVVPIDLRAAAKSFGASVPPVWRALIRPIPAQAVARDGSWASELAALPAERRVEAVTQVVRSEVARILSLGRAASVPIDRPLRELGLDSLMAVELRNALGRRASATLPPSLAFDHPTPAAIARFLLSEVPSLVEKIGAQGAPLEKQNGSHESAGSRPAPQLPVKVPQSALPVPRDERPADRIETIPMGERWLADGFRVIPTPGGFAQRMVDMTQAMAALAALAEAGLRASITHVLVRAAALALARNPRLHQSVVGYRKLTPGAVDIGLSMVGQTTYAPVVVLPDVDRTPLPALVGIIEEATAAARVKEAVDLQNMRRMGWMTPFAFFRRFVIRALQRSFWFRRKLVGTFQVSGVPTIDVGVPLQFYSGSILSFGRVRASVVAVDGRVEVRPMMQLTVCVEATSTDSTRGATLVSEIAAVLESRELVDEACAALASGGARALPPVKEPRQPRAELSAAPGE